MATLSTDTLIVTTRKIDSGFCRIQGTRKVYVRFGYGHAWERYRVLKDGLEIYEGYVKRGNDRSLLIGLMLDAPHD